MIKKTNIIIILTICMCYIFSYKDITVALNNGILIEKEISSFNVKNKKVSEYATDRIIVKVKESSAKNFQNVDSFDRISNEDIKEVDNLKKVGLSVVTFSDKNTDIKQVLEDFNNDPNIEYAEPDYVMGFDSFTGVITNDPRSFEKWDLKSMQVDEAWQIYNDQSNKITVGVNDTGIDYFHPDLSANLKDLSSICYSETGSLISGGCSKYGLNFENGDVVIFPNSETYDTAGHGTHVAGIIGAVGNNGTGTIGVTQNVKMIAGRADSYSFYGDGFFYVSDTIKALDFAIKNGAKIVNASYGGSNYSTGMYDSIVRAKDAGVLLIAASGNGGSDALGDNLDSAPHYPASYNLDNIISVGSIGPNDTLAFYSNYSNSSVDLVAPGGDQGMNGLFTTGGILSTIPGSSYVFADNLNNLNGFDLSGSTWYVTGSTLYTQSSLSYAPLVDSSMTSKTTFSLSGAISGFLELGGSCDFGIGSYDSNYGDNLSFYIIDTDTGNSYLIGTTYTMDTTAKNYIIPISNPALLKNNLKLKINFKSDNDSDIGAGCNFNHTYIKSFTQNNNTYEYMQGTSMATPQVTGVASMLWSYKPEMTYLEVRDILLTTVDDLLIQDKIVTGGKVNAKKAIEEVIRRYGITKTGEFGSGTINSKLMNLDGKIISLSGGTINLTGTGDIINIQNGSNISGTGIIYIGTGTNTFSGSNTILSLSNDFIGNFRNGSGSLITNLFSGTGIYFGYSGTLSGTGVNLKVGTGIYDGPLSQNLFIPINTNYSGSLNYEIYKSGIPSEGISSSISLKLNSLTYLDNFNFTYDNTPAFIPDTIPDSYSFIDQTGVGTGVYITSNTGTITGINTGSIISVVGGEYSINGGSFTSLSGLINNNDTIRLKILSSTSYSTLSTMTGTIGGVNGTFSVTTISDPTPAFIPDTIPDSYSFIDQTGVGTGVYITSNTGTITGINTGSTISVVGGEYSINGGSFTSLSGLINNNDTIRLKILSSTSYSTLSTMTGTIGGVNGTFSVTTIPAPIINNPPSSGGGGGGSGGGGGGSSISITTCTSEHLICKQILSSNSYMFYLKNGSYCQGGDLGKFCIANNVSSTGSINTGIVNSLSKTDTLIKLIREEQPKVSINKILPSIQEFNKSIVFKNSKLNNLLNKYGNDFYLTDLKLSEIEYLGEDYIELRKKLRTEYIDWLKQLKQLDLEDKTKINSKFLSMILLYKDINNSYKSIGTIQTKIVGKESVKYVIYDKDEKLHKLQTSLYKFISVKKDDKNTFIKTNILLGKINILLNNKKLSKDEIKKLKIEVKNLLSEVKNNLKG